MNSEGRLLLSSLFSCTQVATVRSTASISSAFRVLRTFSRGAWNTATCKGLYTRSWRDLYQAAIHEPDMDKLSERITDAESALVIRMRELFYSSGVTEFEEEEIISTQLGVISSFMPCVAL